MGKIIKVDFHRERRREELAFSQFEAAMKRYHKKQRFKLALMMAGFTGLVVLVMMIPFVVSYLTRPHL